MRVLLINPNRYHLPPVPPIGLEYLLAPLQTAGHEVHVADLCFSRDPMADLTGALEATKPDVAAITVRNVDTVLQQKNRFFLDDFIDLARLAWEAGAVVVLGGCGIATMPEAVRCYLGADYAIDGPGESAFVALLKTLERKQKAPTVLNGWAYPPDPAIRHTRGEFVPFGDYLKAGARFGFETQKGCSGRCLFCTEATKPVFTRKPAAVVEEIVTLVEQGARELFCCDSEFNQTLPHCMSFLQQLIERALPIDWTLYMKPVPHDVPLFELLGRSGCSSLTVSVDTVSLYGPAPVYGEADVASFHELAARAGLKVAVDLTVGLPGEPAEAPVRVLELFRRLPAAHRPKSVGVNAAMRLYPSMAMTSKVLADPVLRRHVDPPCFEDLIHPVHYHHLNEEALDRLIGGDPLFRVEGREPGVNYERL